MCSLWLCSWLSGDHTADFLQCVQTWVEGVPVKGKAVKPAKPTKAAALQVLQQLASEHCSAAQGCDAGIPITAEALKEDPASPQPTNSANGSLDLATDLASKEAAQPELALPGPLLDQPADAALSHVESDSEAEASPRGGIAVEEEDDRQAPEALASFRIVAAQQRLEQHPMAQSAAAESRQSCVPDSAAIPDCAAKQNVGSSHALNKAAKGRSRQLPLSKVIQRQRRHMSKSNSVVNGQPDIVLALTDAQQQQMQQEADQQILASPALGTAGTDKCSILSQETCIAASPVQQPDQQMMNEQLHYPDQQPSEDQWADLSSTQLPSHQHGTDEEGASGREPQEQQLWQNLSDALQNQQSSQKLAQLAVTLLARM